MALPSLVALYRLAHFCIVSSLHDGMNLVAKEFVAARDDEDGVLVLSALAGAAQELRTPHHQSVRRRRLRRRAHQAVDMPPTSGAPMCAMPQVCRRTQRLQLGVQTSWKGSRASGPGRSLPVRGWEATSV